MSPRTSLLLLVALCAAASSTAQDAPRVHTSRTTGTQLLRLPKEEDAFGFVVFGDRTGGPKEGVQVLAQAVADTNLLDPDLVLTVGDLVQGYNTTPQWQQQAAEFRSIMDRLRMPWFPVAGNHDIYWRGDGKPVGEHEANYEATFGPLWYAIRHKQCWFVVLYSDEGNPVTGKKDFSDPECQRISQQQFDWLAATLQQAKGARHVFLFLHHPRWIEARYGDDWQKVHALLAKAGNVTAVFAGHIHRMRFDGVRDGIQYYTVASVGAHLEHDLPQAGFLHEFHVVTVRPEGIQVAALPVGTVIDPKSITGDLSEEIDLLMDALGCTVTSFVANDPAKPPLSADGSVDAVLTLRCRNPTKRPIDVTLVPADGAPWTFAPDHQHLVVAANSHGETTFLVQRSIDAAVPFALPQLQLRCDYLAIDRRITLPPRTQTIELPPPADLGRAPSGSQGVLVLDGNTACIELPHRELALPDGPFTVEAWCRPTALQGRRALLNKTENSEFGLFVSDGKVEFLVWLGDGYRRASTKDAVLQTGRWQHVAGVFDGNELRAYVDGRLVAKGGGKGPRKSNELPLFVGADPDGRSRPGSFFAGSVDDVRISKVARYQGDTFTPPATVAADADTVWLLPCDREFGPWLPDAGPLQVHGRVRGSAHCTVESRDFR